VRVHDATVRECDELMLAASIDARDLRAAKCSQRRRRNATLKRWVKQRELRNRFADDGFAQSNDCTFNFR
jgi:hypothetical protein